MSSDYHTPIPYGKMADTGKVNSPLAELDSAIGANALDISALLAVPVIQGRLTLESGVAVSTSDQDNKTTLYFTPFNGNVYVTWNGTSKDYHTFSEISIDSTGLTVSTPYDVFIYDSSGATLELVAWASDTARTTGLDTVAGDLQVKSGENSHTFIGTVYVFSNGGSPVFKDVGGGIDTPAQRGIWNRWNPVRRHMRFGLSVNSYTYATTSWRQINADTNARFDFVIGLNRCEVKVTYYQMAHTGVLLSGIGLDSTAANDTDTFVRGFGGGVAGNATNAAQTSYFGFPGIGKHSLNFIEKASSGTATVLGDAGAASDFQSGGIGEFIG